MQIKDVAIGDVFFIKGNISNPKLKIEEGYVDLQYRIIETGKDDLECVPVSIELLCVTMHREEIIEWVKNAKTFFIPKEEENESTKE